MTTDKYANFALLSEHEREGVDYRVGVSEKKFDCRHHCAAWRKN